LVIISSNYNKTPIAGASGAVTIADSSGKPVQVSQSMAAQAKSVQPGPDGTVTVQGSDGQPVKIPQAALAASQTPMQTMTGGNRHQGQI